MMEPTRERVQAIVGDRYEVEGVLGRGGMGVVFAARHRRLGSPLAIKVLPMPAGEAEQGLARFRREAALAANLSHPHIIPVFEFEVREDLAFLVMPMIEGRTLTAILQERGSLSYRETRSLVEEIASALVLAHQRGIVHRDVKPSNILREESTGRWLIGDFGVAHAGRPGDTVITRTGEVLGTPAYMAPEQAVGSTDVDGRVDLYALAAVACEALTGTAPDTIRDAPAAARALRAACHDISPAVAQALTAPLALDRNRRPPTATAWLEALHSAERRRTWLPLSLAALALVLAGAVAVLRPTSAPSPALLAIGPVAVRGELAGVNLGVLLERAFEDEVRWLSQQYRVISVERLRNLTPADDGAPDEAAVVGAARRLGASALLVSTADVMPNSVVRLRARLRATDDRAPRRVAEATGRTDSLAALVRDVVTGLFPDRIVLRETGSLPKGLDAVRAYVEGNAAFRSAAYDRAVRLFQTVVALDSTFAPAHFKRMLCEILRLRPTQAPAELRTALEAGRRYRDHLNPTTREILHGYEVLVDLGDLDSAHAVLQRLVDRDPSSAEAWFLLGFVVEHFAALMGNSPAAARYSFERAHDADPNFAAPIAELARIAILQENETLARQYFAKYLEIDSTSVWAELARMVDSLLYGGLRAKVRVLDSFERRPTAALETIAVAGAGPLLIPRVERGIAEDAIQVLWERAATDADRAVIFRMRMANLLGTGREAAADSLFRQARRSEIPQGELDRWLLLTAVTATAELGAAGERAAAAARLLAEESDDPTAPWLAARWYRARDAEAARRAVRRLTMLQRRRVGRPLTESLLADLEALERRDVGDTTGARASWESATRRYRIEEVPLGLTGSLWPLRLEQARTAAALADHDNVLKTTLSFVRMAGFIDQLAWRDILLLRASASAALGDPLGARESYRWLRPVLEHANGPRATLRDSLDAWLTRTP